MTTAPETKSPQRVAEAKILADALVAEFAKHGATCEVELKINPMSDKFGEIEVSKKEWKVLTETIQIRGVKIGSGMFRGYGYARKEIDKAYSRVKAGCSFMHRYHSIPLNVGNLKKVPAFVAEYVAKMDAKQADHLRTLGTNANGKLGGHMLDGYQRRLREAGIENVSIEVQKDPEQVLFNVTIRGLTIEQAGNWIDAKVAEKK